MRTIALLVSVLILSGCTLTNLVKGAFFEGGSLARQTATPNQMNALLERVMLSCNDNDEGKNDKSHLISSLKQRGYQQVTIFAGREKIFYNSPTPLYFKGYPVQFVSIFSNDVAIGLPPEAYPKLYYSYDSNYKNEHIPEISVREPNITDTEKGRNNTLFSCTRW